MEQKMDWLLEGRKSNPFTTRGALRFTKERLQALPLILAHHQRTPTNRKRQSWKNSGGLPSKACPTNCSSHPKAKSASAAHHRRCRMNPAANRATETKIVGMP